MSSSSESSCDEISLIPSAKVARAMSKKKKHKQVKQSKEYKEVMKIISDSIRTGEREASSCSGRMSDDLDDFLRSLNYVVEENDQFGWKISW